MDVSKGKRTGFAPLINRELLSETERVFNENIGHLLDQAAVLYAKNKYDTKAINLYNLEMLRRFKCGSRRIHTTVSFLTIKTVEAMQGGLLLNKSEISDTLLYILYKQYDEKEDELLKLKSEMIFSKNNFYLSSLTNRILYAAAMAYPRKISRMEIIVGIKPISEEQEGNFSKSLKYALKLGYIKQTSSGRSQKFTATKSGFIFLKENASLEFIPMVSRMNFIDPNFLIEEAERIIREKSGQTVNISLDSFRRQIASLIKKEAIMAEYSISDERINLIVEKLLKYLNEKLMRPGNQKESLQDIENLLLKRYIQLVEKNARRGKMHARSMILLALLKAPGMSLLYGNIRFEAGLINFWGKFDEIIEQLTKEGKIIISKKDGAKKEESIVRVNTRNVIGTEKYPHLVEMMLQNLKSNKIGYGTYDI